MLTLRQYCPVLCFFLFSVLGTLSATGQCRSDQRRVTVADAIEMTHVVQPPHAPGSVAGQVAQYSPDGRRFALLLAKGNLQQNTNDYMLRIFQTQNALSSNQPEAIVRMSSNSN